MVKVAKKLFTMSVVTLTILWSVGIAALVPTTVNAVDCPELEAGDLFKVAGNSAVYLLNADMERMYFPNSEVYKTWFADYSGVVEIASTCVDAYPAPSKAPYGVNYRPGSRLVKVQISNSVYAVGPNNTKMKIGSEEVAKALYGANWSTLVRDVADVYWPNLVNTGDEMTTADLHDGMLVKNGTKVYSVEGGMLHEVDGDLGVTAGDVRTVSADLIANTEMSNDTATAASLVENPAQTSASEDGEDTTTTTGDLDVSLAASTPDSEEIPKDVMGYTYLTLNAKAGDEDVDITGVTIKRKGLGEYGDFEKVYVEVGGVRHGSKRVLGSDNEVEIYFSTDASKITVPANGTIKLDIVADMSGTSGNSNYLQVTAVETTANLNADLPISGNKMELSNQTAPDVDFTIDSVDSDLVVGDTQDVVAAFNFDGSSEDMTLYSVTLKQEGTVDSDNVTNYTLYYDDEVVAGPVDVDGDYVYFELDDEMTIEEGETYDFEVKADIEGGVDDTVELTLEETTDVNLIGDDNEFNVNVTSYVTDVTTLTIEGGDLTIDEHDTNPKAKTYSPESEDVLVLAAEIEAADESLVVTEMDITITGYGANEMENLTVKLDGKTVCGPVDVDAATITCDEEFEVDGTQKLEVFVDFTDTADGTYTFAIGTGDITHEDMNGDNEGTSTGSATGKTVTVETSTLSLSKNSSYTNRTIAPGAKDYKIGSYTLKAPTSESLTLKKFIVTLGGDASTRADMTDLYVSQDTDVISDPSDSADNDFVVSKTLAAGKTITLDVFATFEDDADTSVTTSLAVTYKGQTTGDTTTTEDVMGQTISFNAGSLTPTVASTNPDGDIVLSDAANVKVFTVQFDADYDTYTVTDLDILMSNPEAVTSVKIGNVEGTIVDDTAEFNDLEIAVTDKTKVDVYATFNTVGDEGVESGTTTTFKLAGYEADAKEGTDLDKADDDISDAIISEEFELRMAKPVLAFAKGSETAERGLLSVGDNQMIKMTVTASGDTVNLVGINVTVAGDVSTTDDLIALYDSSNNLLATTTVGGADTWTFDVEDTDDLEVGDSAVYYLGLILDLSPADGDQVSFKVEDLTWNDDEGTDTTGEYIDALPSVKFLATENA